MSGKWFLAFWVIRAVRKPMRLKQECNPKIIASLKHTHAYTPPPKKTNKLSKEREEWIEWTFSH